MIRIDGMPVVDDGLGSGAPIAPVEIGVGVIPPFLTKVTSSINSYVYMLHWCLAI